MLLFVVVVHVQAFLNCPGTKKLEQILPKKDGRSPEKKAFGWEMWKISSNPSKPPIFRGHVSFQGVIYIYFLFFFGLGWETHQNLPKTAGHSHCNGGGGGMPMAASVRGGWLEGVRCYASKIIHDIWLNL